jgi:hypothetical protein
MSKPLVAIVGAGASGLVRKKKKKNVERGLGNQYCFARVGIHLKQLFVV